MARSAEVNQVSINVKAEDLKDITCTCGGMVFNQVVQAKLIPALYSQTGQPGILQRPCLLCISCGRSYSIEDILKGV